MKGLLIVDDGLLADAIGALLGQLEPTLAVRACRAFEVPTELALRGPHDVAILDLFAPPGVESETLALLGVLPRDMPVVIVGAEAPSADASIEGRPVEFVCRSDSGDALVRAVRRALARGPAGEGDGEDDGEGTGPGGAREGAAPIR